MYSPEMRDHLTKHHGFDAKIVGEMPDHHVEHCVQKMAEAQDGGNMPGDDELPPPPAKPEMPSTEGMKDDEKKEVERYHERALKNHAIEVRTYERLVSGYKMAKQAEEQEQRKFIDRFCEAELVAGRLRPYEMDKTSPNGTMADFLFSLPAKGSHESFSENGTVKKGSVLQKAMAVISARPAENYAERLKQGDGKAPSKEEAEVAKIDKYCEENSDLIEKAGSSKESLIAGFKADRKRNPKLTAEDWLEV